MLTSGPLRAGGAHVWHLPAVRQHPLPVVLSTPANTGAMPPYRHQQADKDRLGAGQHRLSPTAARGHRAWKQRGSSVSLSRSRISIHDRP